MIKSDNHSSLMSVFFDWSLSMATGKVTTQQEAYKYDTRRLAQGNNIESDYPYEVVDTKLRVRGRGRSMRVRFQSDGGKDLRLLGYAIPGVDYGDSEGNA